MSKLRKQIFLLDRLPTVKEFAEYFTESVLSNVNQLELVKYHIQSKAQTAYLGLVRDFHFALLLRESGYFDEVINHEETDLQMKLDIIVKKDDIFMGIQLFAGDEDEKTSKMSNALKTRSIQSGIKEYYFPLGGKFARPQRRKTKNGNTTYELYSRADVEHIAEIFIKESPNKVDSSAVPNQFISLSPHLTKEAYRTGEKTPYSILLIENELSNCRIEELKKWATQGTKVDVITRNISSIEEQKNLAVYELSQKVDETLLINDGRMSSKHERYIENNHLSSRFNWGQYRVEHAPSTADIIVNAGAGSGKTTTMISRIMYLIHTSDVKLDSIVMITFTRESAAHMRKKIKERLQSYYQTTNLIKYLDLMEQVNSMRIMTIDAFSKYLFEQLGVVEGWGNTVSVASYKYRTETIIREEFARYLTEEIDEEEVSYFSDVKEYEMIKFFMHVQSELDKKGLSGDSESLTWDLAEDSQRDMKYQQATQYVIERMANRIKQEKLRDNALTLSDIKRDLLKVVKGNRQLSIEPNIDYIFVDEFQDTDDPQIELLVSLSNSLKARLFVVGDIKQAIYRFRGASHTAFESLKRLKNDFLSYELTINYRSSKALLVEMERLFKAWKQKGRLPNEMKNGIDTGRLISHLSSSVDKKETLNISTTKNPKLDDSILHMYDTLPSDDKKQSVLGILVRKNKEAQKIKELLRGIRKNGRNDLIFEVSVGGGLFKSSAAKDLLLLIRVLKNEGCPESFFALRQSSFVEDVFDVNHLVQYEGDIARLTLEMNRNLDDERWQWIRKVREDLRIKPFYKVLQNAVMELPYKRIMGEQGYQPHELIQYERNLYKILDIAVKRLKGEVNDPVSIYDWLKIQLATNRDEDEADIDSKDINEDRVIRVMTVHKAKGLEFHSVFLPFTDSSLIQGHQHKVLLTSKGLSNHEKVLAFHFKEGDEVVTTASFKTIKAEDIAETLNEETRLLYVAMTRAEQRLWINAARPHTQKGLRDKDTWEKLIRTAARKETSNE
ncbi:exodeoxyribonuclease V subunit beta [Exiguobacterium sp. s189]|uniref:UvrD-helicase domain-containing protein n=1 Tax=Exiguobacterium sp. s189 TaxID=2751263 RepID=UPI001BEA47A5|nr:UvrD-helicase domain-containing protein [Exiguobacterium sp. s189]